MIERRQLFLFCSLFAAVVAVLGMIYFAFMLPPKAVLYEDMREADAAEIVNVLEKQGIEYRLEDDGHRILVPRDEVSHARVLVAGSGIAMGGVVGFELFNETDMGLTEFAQKVNYQRALQGELARTIMSMDGIAFARVHLSLPERSMFRAAQTPPKAAVTLQTESGATIEPAWVLGIQQLVSAAVTNLPAREVAVLDHHGRLLSEVPVEGGEAAGPLDERSALEEFFRARARSVTERLVPGLRFDIRVLAIPGGSAPLPTMQSDKLAGEAALAPAPEAGAVSGRPSRNFRLQIVFRTEMDLDEDERAHVFNAIVDATGIDLSRGDVLRFEAGSLAKYPATDSAPKATGSSDPLPPHAAGPGGFADDPAEGLFGSAWAWTMAGFLAVLVLIALRRRSDLSAEQQQSFADLLGEKLALEEGFDDER